jgi:hypothetical protein
VWIFGAPGANFDLVSFSFQVPICGSSAKDTAAAAKKQSATINPVVSVFIHPFEPEFPFRVNTSFFKTIGFKLALATSDIGHRP